MAGRSNKSKNKGKGGINSKNATQNNPMVDVEPASNDISLGKEQIVDHAGQNSDVSMDPNSFVNGPEHTEKDSPHNHLHISENGNEIDSSSTVKHVNVVSGELHLYPVTVKGPCGEKLELQVAETRFASHTIVMRRLLKVKDALSQMVIGHQWGVWKISNLERAQRIRDLILNESWWARVAYVLDFTEPIMTMLRFADTDTPCLGDVYDGMDTMVEKVKHSIQAHESDPTQCEALCKQVQAIINHRWNKMTTPLHLLAYALSPRYYSEEIAGMPGRVAPFADEEVAEGCYKALSRLFPLEEMHEKVREEFGLFASGLKHSPFALKDQNRMGAITWWYMYGQPFKHLQPLAIKVLSQINPGDSVMDLRQFLLDAPETCFYTCYDLIMVMKDGSRHQLADYFEIGDVGDITTGGCSLEMVTALYDDRSVRSHVHRVRDLISTFTLHSSLSTSFAMEYEATRSSSGGDKKSEVPELEGLGFMEDPNGLLENLVVSPSSQEIKCVESIAFSSFNPAPGYRRLLGDLIYLDVVTLEGQSYCITAHTRGYYINASTGDILDPWPAKSAHEATSLVGLLRQSSNKFKKGFREVLERKASCHPFENVPSLLPLHSWLGISPPPAHRRDVSRAEDALALPYGTESIGMQRDWNEELQSCREFPRKTIQDRILRDRALYKVSCDFVDAAIKGAKGVISRCIPPINPTDPERFHMYVHNNIFFSFAVDADFTQMQQSYEQKTSLDNASALANDEGNRCDALADHKDVNNVETPKGEALLNQNISDVILNEVKEPESEKTEVEVLVPKEETDPDAGLLENDTSQLIDSEQATYASANNDLKGTKAYNNADISGLYTLAMAIVDYRGHRVVAQSIIPGILQGDKSDSLLYGSVDNGKKICWNDKFHEKVLEAAKVLHIKEHEVLDGSGNRVKMAAPVECKGIVGSDDRHYLLDLMRTTPRDANYMGPGSRYCVLRPELVASFCQVESQERAKKNNEKDATNGSALQEDVPAVLLNPNILTDFKLAGDSKEVASDESLVKKAGAYLLDVVLPKFVQDLSSLEVSPMDGQTLTEALHAHGINVRYFGKVANMAKLLPHIVDLCIVEMVVRAAKHVLKGVLRETQDHDLGGAIAHFFNCFLGHDAPPCTKAGSPAGDKPRKKGKVAHSKKGANQLPSTADNTSKSIVEACKNHSKTLLQSKSSGQIQSSYLCITSELVWIDIKECVKFKYQFELPEDVKKRVKKMSTFRNLCQKVGITIGARKYDLDSETPFNISDILDMHTVVKHSATVCSDARDLIETGKLQLAEGKLNEAYELFHEAFSILQQVSGPMHREVANCCRYLAMVLYHAGDMAGAIMQQHKELIINERCLGLDHPDTAHSYGNMALFYHGLNQTELALRHMARTLLLLNVSCGPDHPDVAATFINIAMMYQDIGRMNIALRYLQEALKKNERLLGHDHIQTAVCYHALAIAFNCMGAYKLSLQHERSTYNILAKQLGEDDSRTRDSANWIKTFQIRDVQINAQKQKGQAVDLDATQKAVDALKARPDLIQAFQAATGGPTGSRSRTSLNKAATAVLMSDTLPRGRGMDERGARAAAEVRKKAVARGLNVRPQGVPAQSLPQFTELLNIINSSMASKAPPGDSPSTSSQEAGKESSTNSENEIRTAEVCVEETRENVPEENSEDKTPLGLGTGLTSFENKKQKSKPKDSSD